jgi:uncharacterized coiled-coil protein SlyX
MEEKPLSERVAVLETKVSGHTEKLDKFFEKLDEHIIEEAERDAKLQVGLENLTRELTETNTNLKVISNVVATNNVKLVQIDTIWLTLVKIVSIVTLIVSGAWGVFQYFSTHHPTTDQNTGVVK